MEKEYLNKNAVLLLFSNIAKHCNPLKNSLKKYSFLVFLVLCFLCSDKINSRYLPYFVNNSSMYKNNSSCVDWRGYNKSSIDSTAGSNKSILLPPPSPTNDNCSGAISLTVSSSCSYLVYTNASATASAGITAPGCANYLGGDVWFTAVVPATGILTVDTQTGVITDGGLAFYTGSCGNLTLLACDDDSSTNGLMPTITQSGLTPGQTIYIRFWEYGNDNNGTFGICANSPSCVVPIVNSTTNITTTSATM